VAPPRAVLLPLSPIPDAVVIGLAICSRSRSRTRPSFDVPGHPVLLLFYFERQVTTWRIGAVLMVVGLSRID